MASWCTIRHSPPPDRPGRPSAVVRRLGAGDVDALRRIRLTALKTSPGAFGTTHEAERAQPDAHFASRLATSIVLGAFEADRVIGMLGCKRYDGAREAHKAFLWGFYVEPDRRGCGVAGALLGAGLEAVAGDVEQVHLTVVADNRVAIGLYERFGFRAYGTEPRSLKTDGVYSDELLMVLFLSDRGSP